MTSLQREHPTRPVERRSRARGERSARSASRPRRAGMVSEAIIARYIRDLAAHDRRVHGASDRPQVVTR
ncbi:MAG: hypothetical protein QOF83_3825 [Solirubrobacteraceae bacterium]|jgi:hypothetical protein|nr:hypothetical protein [Solirubrobacteraceae bacterium]